MTPEPEYLTRSKANEKRLMEAIKRSENPFLEKEQLRIALESKYIRTVELARDSYDINEIADLWNEALSFYSDILKMCQDLEGACRASYELHK